MNKVESFVLVVVVCTFFFIFSHLINTRPASIKKNLSVEDTEVNCQCVGTGD